MRPPLVAALSIALGVTAPATPAERAPASVAHAWTEALLFAIRHDAARPPVHARNLYHLAAAMHDAWAAHGSSGRTVYLGTDAHPACTIEDDELAALRTLPAGARAASRERAIGHAAWTLLRNRYRRAADAPAVRGRLDALALATGLARIPDATDRAARLGVLIGRCLIGAGRRDGSNEDADHRNLAYTAVNPPLNPIARGNAALAAPSRWQPLAVPGFRDQAGRPGVPSDFLGADWGSVTPFALEGTARTVRRDGEELRVHLDPGPPPRLETETDAYVANFALVLAWSAHLDPTAPRFIDIAPRGRSGELGADDLETDFLTQLAHYDADGGQTTRTQSVLGEDEAFERTLVPLGDYARVVAEYWADGVDSETPPGHWLSLYNEHVSTHPALERRLGGTGPVLDPLAFDIVAYLALGGALHDAAIAAWSVKSAYDYVRPISAIRYLAEPRALPTMRGGDAASAVLPVVPGRVELVESGDPLAGPGGVNVGQTKVRAWRGPDAIADSDEDVAGVGWILAADWWPYQRPSFVTPPFAGYVSGHSTFSRAAATVLERLTGSPRWPGGSAGFTAKANEFLTFERGPSVDVPLRWATYRDAADETSLSRIWGGIHPPADDLPARRMGAEVGESAWRRTLELVAARAPDEVAVAGRTDATSMPGASPGTAGAVLGCSSLGKGDGSAALLLGGALLALGRALGRASRRRLTRRSGAAA